jgi:hypothetical protein
MPELYIRELSPLIIRYASTLASLLCLDSMVDE